MKYSCTNCGYIYDESLGDIEEDIKPGTRFYEISDYFYCPVCSEGTESFEIIKEQINYIDFENTKDIFELDHFPNVNIDGDKIIITVGKIEEHPLDEEHYISSIILLDENGDIIEEKFIKPSSEQKIVFDFDYLYEFQVVVKCSIHGLWGRKFKEI